jgi:hypothetical protein
MVWTLALARYVSLLVCVNEPRYEYARYAIVNALVGKRDARAAECLSACFAGTHIRSGRYCMRSCGRHGYGPAHAAAHLMSLGLLELAWEPRIRWFKLEPCGLAYWTRFEAVQSLVDGISHNTLLSPTAAWWLSGALSPDVRAELISFAFIAFSWACRAALLPVARALARACLRGTATRLRLA